MVPPFAGCPLPRPPLPPSLVIIIIIRMMMVRRRMMALMAMITLVVLMMRTWLNVWCHGWRCLPSCCHCYRLPLSCCCRLLWRKAPASSQHDPLGWILMHCNSIRIKAGSLILAFLSALTSSLLAKRHQGGGKPPEKKYERHKTISVILNSNLPSGQHKGFVYNIEQCHDNMDTFRSLGLKLCCQIIFLAQYSLFCC